MVSIVKTKQQPTAYSLSKNAKKKRLEKPIFPNQADLFDQRKYLHNTLNRDELAFVLITLEEENDRVIDSDY